jgi:hypothetical protein
MRKIKILASVTLVSLVFVSWSANAAPETCKPVTTEVKAVPAPPAPPDTNSLEKKFDEATALLFVQTMDGGMKFLCTATAFEKKGKMTHFVSAAHCAAEDNTTHGRVNVSKANFFITFDDPDKKKFFAAKIIGAGYQHRGDDFLVLEAELDQEVAVIPLADKDPSKGELISNIASPGGLGKQLFRGHITMEKLKRSLISGEINWKDTTLIQTMVGPGSSGSSVISLRQNGIVAFIVGVVRSSPSVVSIPVSKFKAFWTDVQANKYKWYDPKKPDGNEIDGGELSADKLIKQINSHFPGSAELHLPLPHPKDEK